MIGTYFLYTTILVLAAFFAYIAQYGRDASQRMWARIFCFMCLFIPAALRYGIGRDYFTYIKLYVANFPTSDHGSNLEPGFVLIGRICLMLGLSPIMFMAIISGITYAVICFYLPRKHIFTVIIFYILSFIYLSSYNISRQALAMSMLLCGFSLLYNNQKIKGMLFFIAAPLIHYSCLVVLPIMIFSYLNINTFIRICLIIVFTFFILNENFLLWLISIATLINPRNKLLVLLLEKTPMNAGITFMIMMLPAVLIMLNSKKISMYNNGKFILNANAFYLSTVIASSSLMVFGRFTTLLFIIPLFSIQILYNANKKYAKLYHSLLIVCYCALFFRYIEYHTTGADVLGGSYYLTPYKSIFER